MKKTNFTIHSLARVAYWCLPLLLLVLNPSRVFAQPECNLVCNDHVNVSMPANACEREITYDDLLENPDEGCTYEVALAHPFGTARPPLIPAYYVNRSHIGYTFVASVYALDDNGNRVNSCWGYVTIEDKAPPQPGCFNRNVSCFQVSAINALVNVVVDNCAQEGKSVITSLTYFDFGCDTTYTGRVARTIRSWDTWGNTGTCNDTLTIRRDSLESVKCAQLVQLECKISCGSPLGTITFSSDKASSSYPSPDLLLKIRKDCRNSMKVGDVQGSWYTDERVVPMLCDSSLVGEAVNMQMVADSFDMWPVLGGFCKMTVGYTDQLLTICPGGAGFKIRREWRIADWCTGEDTVCVQYIKVEDTQAPVVKSGSKKKYWATASAHTCLATVNVDSLLIDDCSRVTQTYVLEYLDESHPGKISVLTGSLPGKITLPAAAASLLPGDFAFGGLKCFQADITLQDKCYNTSYDSISICIIDNSPPTPVCDEYTQTTVDPATCWARVYAHDLDNGSRDNCCNTLHFAVATMADIDAAREELTETLEACGSSYVWHKDNKAAHEWLINQYINCYVFADYVDLTQCGNNPVVLRVYEACGIPRYDPHVFPCSPHEWFCYNAYTTDRIWRNYLKVSGADDLCADPTILCRKDYWKWLRDVVEDYFGNDYDLVKAAYYDGATLFPMDFGSHFGTTCYPFYFEGEVLAGMTQALPQGATNVTGAPGNTCSRLLYSDCMVNILVDDKTPAVCEDPDDIFWFCDNVSDQRTISGKRYYYNYWRTDRVEYADKVCYSNGGSTPKLDGTAEHRGNKDYDPTEDASDGSCYYDSYKYPYNEIECTAENDDDLTDANDPTGKAYGWYGCNIYGGSHDGKDNCHSSYGGYGDLNGTAAGSNGGYNSWAPVYCHTWLCLDRKDSGGKIDPKSAFFTPIFDTNSDGELDEPGDGEFLVWDNCSTPELVSSVDDGFIDNCGNGWIRRTWTFSTGCENETIVCDQKIITKHRSDFEVVFPADVTVTCESDAGLSPDDPNVGRPMIMDDDCELVGVNYVDERYDVIPDACYKIVRTWKLIDWCKYNPNQTHRDPEVIVDDRLVANEDSRYCVYRNLKDDGDGYMTYTQIIKVIDETAPTAGVIADTTFCVYTGYDGAGAEDFSDCTPGTYTSPNFSATDQCTPSNQIRFRWLLDLDSDGSIDDFSGAGVKYFTHSELTPGTHTVHIIAEDVCGNADTSEFEIEVKDCKRPTPYCYNGIATVIMPSSGTVTVWASDLDAGSYDNCTPKADLIFTFDEAGLQPSITFNCDSIANGVSASKVVKIWVHDAADNHDYCETYILLQDNVGNRCTDVAGAAGTVAGKVATETTEPVEHVILESKSGSNAIPAFKTDVKGTYSFSGLPMHSNYTITPKRDDDPTNGVSTIDLVLIQKHILGVQALNSAYKVIAADVDRSNDVTAVDLVELRKLILTVYDKLPNNTSWRFAPKSHTFSNINNPWGFPEKIDIANLSKDELNRDFVGIKVGDVNGNVVPHSLLGAEARDNGTSLKFRAEDRQLKVGEEAVIEFTAENFRNIEGYQFSLALKGLELKGVKSGVLKVNESNFGLNRLGEGYITTSWNESKGISAGSNEILFSITVKATKVAQLSESLVINSRYTRAEAYDGVKSMGVSLEVGNKAGAGYALHQNTPNPFKAATVIGYELAKADKVTLKITDVTGKVVRVYNQDGVKGYNQLKVNRNEVTGAGVLYYTIETKDYSATKKMILVD
ncbi:MAG TPA: T9SS type A sorting domain-containing protein [Saprospiraceae bacterium]|nr:T9SS type A sorting domain-containing protein [Saprospiraceae bacterium]